MAAEHASEVRKKHVSSGLSYKGRDLSRSDGGWEDDITLGLKVDDPLSIQHDCTNAHTLGDLFLNKVPLDSPKPTTKASGLISSTPHQACKDLDPTRGILDNIPLA